MENKNYICAICGTAHATIADRAKCEYACVAKMEAEAAKAAEVKKNEEFNACVAEVRDAFDKAYALDEKMFEKYGVHYIYPYHNYENCNPYLMVLKHFIR